MSHIIIDNVMYDKKECTNQKLEFHKFEEVLDNHIKIERPTARITFETFYERYENKYGKKHPIFRKIRVRYKGIELNQIIFFFTDARESNGDTQFFSHVYKETLRQLQIALKKIDMAKSFLEDPKPLPKKKNYNPKSLKNLIQYQGT